MAVGLSLNPEPHGSTQKEADRDTDNKKLTEC